MKEGPTVKLQAQDDRQRTKVEGRWLSVVSEDSPSRVMVLSVESVVRDGTAVFKLLASEDVNGGIASVRTTDDRDGG
jgi:hypothetical protein